MTTVEQRYRAHESLGDHSAIDALAAFAAGGGTDGDAVAIGFCYSPQRARWFRLDAAGVPTDETGRPIELTGVFELRAFTPQRELRWHHTANGRGPAVLVGDAAVTDEQPASDGPAVHGQPYRRLLWGVTHEPSNDGWLSLSAARIGTLPVPAETGLARVRVWLEAVEYVAIDAHGNASIVDERMIGLTAEPIDGSQESR